MRNEREKQNAIWTTLVLRQGAGFDPLPSRCSVPCCSVWCHLPPPALCQANSLNILLCCIFPPAPWWFAAGPSAWQLGHEHLFGQAPICHALAMPQPVQALLPKQLLHRLLLAPSEDCLIPQPVTLADPQHASEAAHVEGVQPSLLLWGPRRGCHTAPLAQRCG